MRTDHQTGVERPIGSAVAPRYHSVAAAAAARHAGPDDPDAGYLYARFGTESSRHAERVIAAALGAPWAVVATCGTTAIDVAISGVLLDRPDAARVIAVTEELYVGTRRYFERVLSGLRGVDVVTIPFAGSDSSVGAGAGAAAEAVRRVRPLAVVTESITNPFLSVADVAPLAEACQRAGAVLVVDATAAPPPNPSALDQGAHLVVHSATKYLNGRNDVLAGVVAGTDTRYRDQCLDYRRLVGGVLDAVSCERLVHDAGDLTARFTRQAANARRAADLLTAAAGVSRVWAASGADCALVTFELAVPSEAAVRPVCEAFVDAAVPAIPFSASFGSTASTMTLVGLLDRDLADRAVLRLSCGTEEWTPIEESLRRALDAADRARGAEL